jgi:diaminohydroxyphosphoribosylaminopyrimidine deaminase/5-amino-6-(5-phosphoribosylamino)uracil reductase
VIADDPALTVRLDGTTRQPVRIVMDSTLRIPLGAQLLQDNKAPTWIFAAQDAPAAKRKQLEQLGARVIILASKAQVDVREMLRYLGDNAISSLLVEGGATVNGAFLRAGAIQKVISYISCKLVGGQTAPTPFGGSGITHMDQAIPLKDIAVERLSDADIRISGYPDWGSA